MPESDSRLTSLLIPPATSIRKALETIDRGARGIALVADREGRLLGTVTDGDVRRALLKGVGLDAPVEGAMNPRPMTVSPDADTQTIRRICVESKLRHIPVVDSNGRLVDLAFADHLLSVPLSNPDITDRERQAVLDVLSTNHLSLGPKVVEFEEKIAAFAGRRFGIAVNSGTSGLHLIVKAMGLGPGDEVITTPFSFIASANCLLYEDARPVFVDIEPDTYNLDPDRIEAAITPRTKAILAVDVFGQPARYERIETLARARGLRVISDCCESIGAEYRGRKAGSFGLAGVFAFYPNKQITTGEGGIIVTDDSDLARLCRSYRNQGRGEQGGWLCHERLGYNYRLSDISAALGVAQLERIDEILERRQLVADAYAELLSGIDGVRLPIVDPSVSRMSWFVYVVRLDDRYTRADRDRVIRDLSRQGIGANAYFQPIHLQPFYAERFGFREGLFPVAEAAGQRTIALPFHNQLTKDQAVHVAKHLKASLASLTAA